jgi:pimeloyl-ACP methyl ester carboxylesterase
VLCLHGQDGNLGNSVEWLGELHGLGVNVFAFDYRGYGKSEFVRPSEKRWREDTEQAIQYLTNTRHIAADAIVIAGDQLGANLALEVAAAHPELAGVIVREPLPEAMDTVFGDGRAKLVPAHWLVSDRYDMDAAARGLLTPSMWILPAAPKNGEELDREPEAYRSVTARKALVWVGGTAASAAGERDEALGRWLKDLKTGAAK